MTAKCYVCGKDIDLTIYNDYIYKKEHPDSKSRTIYFCGWNCMRTYEKKEEKNNVKRRYAHDSKRRTGKDY